MAKLTTAEMIDAIKELTVLELNELVKACEEEFGVSAAAGVVVAAAGAGANLHRAGPGGRKKHIKGGAKGLGLSLSLSPPRTDAFPNSFLFVSSGRHALMPRGWIFLLFSK